MNERDDRKQSDRMKSEHEGSRRPSDQYDGSTGSISGDRGDRSVDEGSSRSERDSGESGNRRPL